MLDGGEIAVAAIAGITVFINTLGLVSVVRNYGRLRQRMYLFVISLTMANVIVGIAFLADSIIKMLDQRKSPDQWNNQSLCDTKPRGWMIATESLKCASIILSALNSIVLTFTLHKRTTRMGRHREDSSSLSNPHTEGNSSLHLPAFDTMMRVLSFASSSEKGDEKHKMAKNDGKENSQKATRNSSSESRASSTSNEVPQYYNCQQERRKSHVAARFNEKKKMSKFASILVPSSSLLSRSSTRFSHASDCYVGRHSISVVSMRTTVLLIFIVWLCFVTLWITPVIMRSRTSRKSSENSTMSILFCPQECRLSISEVGREMESDADTRQDDSGSILGQNQSRKLVDSNEVAKPTVEVGVNSSGLNTAGFAKSFTSQCSGCSNNFFPLTKIEIALSAVIIMVTWLYMLYSSMRLLWLRKHSNNVFVRCSALWRFMLFTAIFHLLTTSPYVTLCFIDVTKNAVISSQYLSLTSENMVPETMTSFVNASLSLTDTSQNMISRDEPDTSSNIQINCIVTSSSRLHLTLSSFFILFHTAFSPLFYLLRLLGIRRLVTFF